MKKEALILIGPSGAGKSTFTRKYRQQHATWVVASRDAIREALVPGHKQWWYKEPLLDEREDAVTEVIHTIIKNSAQVIIDETNLNRKRLQRLEHYLHFLGFDIKYKIVGADIPLDELKRRVIERDGPIDVSYIDKQYAIFQELKNQICC